MKAKTVERNSRDVLPPLTCMFIKHARNIGMKFSTKSLIMNPNMKVLFKYSEIFFILGNSFTFGSLSKRKVRGRPKMKIVR